LGVWPAWEGKGVSVNLSKEDPVQDESDGKRGGRDASPKKSSRGMKAHDRPSSHFYSVSVGLQRKRSGKEFGGEL